MNFLSVFTGSKFLRRLVKQNGIVGCETPLVQFDLPTADFFWQSDVPGGACDGGHGWGSPQLLG